MKFVMEIEVDRIQGKFASRDEILEELTSLLDGQSITTDEGADYKVTVIGEVDK